MTGLTPSWRRGSCCILCYLRRTDKSFSECMAVYYLKCGSEDSIFFQARRFAVHNVLKGTDKGNRSVFRRVPRTNGQFQISLVDKSPGTEKRHPMYIATNKDSPYGLCSIIIGKGHPITCKMDGNYIEILSPQTGYLGYNERSGLAEFVEKKSLEKAGAMWLQFEWQKLKLDSAEDVMGAPLETPGSPVEYEPNQLQPTSDNASGNDSASTNTKL